MSSKQDRAGVRTAQDLEQKYNLSSIVTIKKAVEKNALGLESTNNELNNFIEVTTKNLEEIQNQVDGNLTTWFYSGVPTTTNPPANEWTTYEEKAKHVGDLYYDKDTGYAYRWFEDNGEFSWTKMSDSDVTEALAIANVALDTADSKRRVFVVQPTTPYDVGDIWFRNNEDLYRCATARESGAFNASDFVIATKYTDDTVANEAKAIANELKTTVETHYVTNAKLETTKNSINSSVEKLALQVDEKNKVFTTKPKPPYYVGDVYVLNDKIYYCTTERTTGSYTESDWELSVDAGTLVSKTEFNQTADDIRGSVETLDNDYQATKTTRKQATGNPTYISDSGGYALEKDFLYGMSIQEISTQNDNVLFMKQDGHRNMTSTVQYNVNSYNSIDCTYTGNVTYPYVDFRLDSNLLTNGTWYLGGMATSLNSPSGALLGINKINIETGSRTYYREISFTTDNLNTMLSTAFTIDELETHYYVVRFYLNKATAGVSGTTYNANFANVFVSKKNEFVESIPNSPTPNFPSEIINNKGIENLFDYENTSNYKPYTGSISKIENGIRIQQGVSGTYKFCYYLVDVRQLLGKTLTLSCDYKANASNNPRTAIYWNVNTDSKYQIAILTGNGGTFTIPKQAQADQIMILFYSNFNGTGNAGDYIDYTNIMLCEGTFKEHYLPYGSNYLIQKICGKNIFNRNIFKNNYYVSSTGEYVLYDVCCVWDYIKVKPNTTYTLIYQSNDYTFSQRISEYTNDKTFIKRNITSKSGYSFTTSSTTEYINLSGLKTDTNIQIEVGDTATEYEPYKETIITYDLQGNELCENRNTKDNAELVSGVLTKGIQERILDGSESWTYASNGSYFYLSMSDLKINAIVKSNYYTSIAFADGYSKRVDYGITGHNTYSRLCVRNKDITSLADWKTYLQELNANGNPLKIQYELIEPETIQLEPTEITLYEGINNIYTESNVDVGEVDITYLTDSVLNTQYATKSEVKIAEENITSSINSRIDDTALGLKQELNTSIQQTANNITSEVASTYATNDEVGSLRNEMSTKFTQTNNTFEMQFKTLNSEVSNIDQLVNTNQATLEKYVRFIDGALELGNNESPISLKIENDMLAFYQNDTKIAYISNNKLYITDGFFTNSLRIDSFGFFKEDNGSLSFGKVG